MKLVLLTTIDDSISANLLKSKLESEDIPCVLINEHITDTLTHLKYTAGFGVRVMVFEDQVEEARQFL